MADRLACVFVLFNPLPGVECTVRRLAARYPVVLVVNAADEGFLRLFDGMPSVSVLRNSTNVGLATALNRGAEFAFSELGVSSVILFDQDSEPEVGMPDELLAELLEQGDRVACIGPQLLDRKRVNARYVTNRQLSTGSRSIPTSGTVIRKEVFEAVGPMMESLFIDGIDHEWCFRACHKGYLVMVSARTMMLHDMGDEALNYFGRYKPVHRSPIRHYFIVRNTIALAKLSYLPFSWRVIELIKTVRRMAAYLIFSLDRWQTLRLLAWAIFDGARGCLGPCKHVAGKGRS